jgi:hypothetical protein
MRYGLPPKLLGQFDCDITEMQFRQYLPISVPQELSYSLDTPSLDPCKEIIDFIRDSNEDEFYFSYVYLTVKHLWVSGEFIGNRPGWHSDGFGTNDINYVWADRVPTDYLIDEQDCRFDFEGADCDRMYSYIDNVMMKYCAIVNYSDRELIRLDPSVIHRSPVGFDAGMRTFVKVSLSDQKYNLLGNAINHKLNLNWDMVERDVSRNHPHKN